ncbi:FKBP-type peptidyl-prolyl cis-trans isomerase [Simkania negevensis]|uniref:Peptidyl-prolyl cis-trans isomerase n=1 Tax=Simkania negevensis (strain ATCC VR-1471 / DSM 27360 / Z) TaxID=331113 RepID=F8L521_SIMNZ|nr:FKBP-type peptidyl-prolyl cis-trans isomerase [Simkania negevensis]CCB87902.1 peptidyl-prolyl cis-trans isomerase Mip [Simkania negevensis Z]
MMIWNKWCFFLATFLSLTCCCSEENKNEPIQKHQSEVSEDLAQLLWNIMQTYEGEYSFKELVVNLWKLNAGRQESKALDECFASLMESLEKKAIDQEIINLQIADSYLQKLKTMNDIHELVQNKLYYKIIIPGTGEAVKDLSRSSPLISFKEKTINGEILSENTSGIRLPFSEVIAGLQNGLEGIRVGEKREIFIHPDLAYGEFPKPEPYSLIVIEVTLISL